MAAIHLTSENFETEVLSSDVPVLVDFWASWCGPCKMITPAIDQLSDEFSGKAKVCKVDVDQCGELAVRYGVMSIPTIIIFKSGEIVSQSTGAAAKSYYADMLNQAL